MHGSVVFLVFWGQVRQNEATLEIQHNIILLGNYYDDGNTWVKKMYNIKGERVKKGGRIPWLFEMITGTLSSCQRTEKVTAGKRKKVGTMK